MRKALTAVVAVLVVGSSAIGQIDLQYQTWSLGLTNDISLDGGAIDASTVQGIGTLSVQDLTSGAATAGQAFGAVLFQAGGASTSGSAIGLTQTLTVAGIGLSAPINTLPGQQQEVATSGGAVLQAQGVQIAGDQVLQKTGVTSGEVGGINIVAFGMGQLAENQCNDAAEAAIIIGVSLSEMAGECDSLGTVTTGMDATVIQVQQAH